MAAECLLLASGDGTWEGSARLAEKTLTDDLGLAAGQFVVKDGSGYSRHNRITPVAMTTLLTKALSMNGADAFLSSLPVGGEDGSLAKRLGGAQGRVLAKTGYIAGVSCLSGYVLNGEGKPAYAFSVLVNKNVDLTAARAFQDEVCAMLALEAK
jgi:D-alanyl-D-alanine carboxypeptidase/D-alanyl-D-alanine-endopeptidase (penicillin-binding protein 4)